MTKKKEKRGAEIMKEGFKVTGLKGFLIFIIPILLLAMIVAPSLVEIYSASMRGFYEI
jgi:hypothetical protein